MTTVNMGMTLPTVGATIGPDYGTQINAAMQVIDEHDHSTGSGVPIRSAAILIDADLNFNGYDLGGLRSLRLDNQASVLVEASDLRNLYSVAGDLYYNNGSGTAIQITSGVGLNAASIGGIGGDYATSTAAVAYSSTTKTFTFTQASGISAKMAFGDISLTETVGSANAITIKSPSGLASAYTLTLPAAMPADNTSTNLVVMTTAGVLSTTNQPTLREPKINDASRTNTYNIVASEITSDRNITLPALTTADVFVFADFIQTLTNKTLTSPVINSSVTGDATYVTTDATDATSPTAGGSFRGAGGAAFAKALWVGGLANIAGALTLQAGGSFSGTFTGTPTFSGSPVLTTPDINGGTADSLTSLSIRSTGAAFDLTLASAEVLSAGRTLTINVGNAARALTLTGDLIKAGTDALTLTTGAATNATFPNGTGTLAYLAGTNVWSGAATFSVAGSPTTFAIKLNGATSQTISFSAGAAAVPALTTRSAGTKIVFFDSISGSATDYAVGIAGNELWHSISAIANHFSWYAITTEIMRVDGNANLHVNGASAPAGSPAGLLLLKTGAVLGTAATGFSQIGHVATDVLTITAGATATGEVSITNTRNATSTTAAALVVAGGGGFGGSIWVGDAVVINSLNPLAVFIETDVTADNKRWHFDVSAETFSFRAVNDVNSAGNNIFTVDRTGITVDSFNIAAPSNITGVLRVGTGSTTGVVGLGDVDPTATNVGIFRTTTAGALGGGNVMGVGGYAGIAFTASAAVLGSQGAPKMFIDTSGNVLIGTAVAPTSQAGGLGFQNGATLGAATIDKVSVACVDVAAADAALQIQTEAAAGLYSLGASFTINTDKFTVAAATGNTVVAGTLGVTGATTLGALAAAGWPSVWAYRSAALSSQDFTTATEIILDAEVFDTNSNFNTTTGRFTPTVAGKYVVLAKIRIANWTPSASGSAYMEIRKNSAETAGNFVQNEAQLNEALTTSGSIDVQCIFDMNGSTDYLSLWLVIATDTSIDVAAGANVSYLMVSRIG